MSYLIKAGKRKHLFDNLYVWNIPWNMTIAKTVWTTTTSFRKGWSSTFKRRYIRSLRFYWQTKSLCRLADQRGQVNVNVSGACNVI